MNLKFSGEYKQLGTNITYLILCILLLAAALLPSDAFAFSPGLPLTPLPLVTAVTATQQDLAASAEADELPNYSYTQSGAMLAVASPVTKPGIHKPKPKPVAIAPVYIPAVSQNVPTSEGAILRLIGEASYYSRAGCLGCDPAMIMANGQPLNDHALTMAIGANHKHLVGHRARVTSLATGKSVVVLITDTGGFYQAKYGHRVADLTVATKNAIGMAGGTGQVQVEVF